MRAEIPGEKCQEVFLVSGSHSFPSVAAFRPALRLCDTPPSSNHQFHFFFCLNFNFISVICCQSCLDELGKYSRPTLTGVGFGGSEGGVSGE